MTAIECAICGWDGTLVLVGERWLCDECANKEEADV